MDVVIERADMAMVIVTTLHGQLWTNLFAVLYETNV